METTSEMDDMAEVLLDYDGVLVLPPNGFCGEGELTLNPDKSLVREGQGGAEQPMGSFPIFNLEEHPKDLQSDLFDALLLARPKDETLLVTPPSTPLKRPLATLSPEDENDCKRLKIFYPESPEATSHVTPELELLETLQRLPALQNGPCRKRGEEPTSRCKELEQDDKGVEATRRTASEDAAPPARPKHVCGECGKIFKRAHNLKIHGRLHSGATPYACPFAGCSKQFRWKSSIVSHMNWHRTKRGDTLPGEPGDTSIQSAALRQGTTRGRGRGNAKKTDAGAVEGSSGSRRGRGKGRKRGDAGKAVVVQAESGEKGQVATASTTAESCNLSGSMVELEDLEGLGMFADEGEDCASQLSLEGIGILVRGGGILDEFLGRK